MYGDLYFHSFFFFNDTATTEIYTLSLHDALPISTGFADPLQLRQGLGCGQPSALPGAGGDLHRSEEHTSELQSQSNLVCRLLLEKNKRCMTFINVYFPVHNSPSCQRDFSVWT